MNKQEFDALKPGEYLAVGTTSDSPRGLNMTNSGETLHWVAVKGWNNDWAMYCADSDSDSDCIRNFGDKVHDKQSIKNVIDVDDEVMQRYRH